MQPWPISTALHPHFTDLRIQGRQHNLSQFSERKARQCQKESADASHSQTGYELLSLAIHRRPPPVHPLSAPQKQVGTALHYPSIDFHDLEEVSRKAVKCAPLNSTLRLI
jgi:hypothetical protein